MPLLIPLPFSWWVILVVIVVAYTLFHGLLAVIRDNEITARTMIAAVIIGIAGVAAALIQPLLLMPLMVIVLVLLIYPELTGKETDRGSGDRRQGSYSGGQNFRPGRPGDRVIDAEFRVKDEPVPGEKPARPKQDSDPADAAAQGSSGERKAQYAEQKKREMEQKLRAREAERLRYIHGLSSDRYQEFLLESEKFRKEFGKNVQCDVCGRWEGPLTALGNRTCCPQCLPGSTVRGDDWVMVPPKDGTSASHKK